MTIPDLSVKHLGETTIDSPLQGIGFIPDEANVIYGKDSHEVLDEYQKSGRISSFEQAGPRAKIYHDPAWTHAAILTAGVSARASTT